MTIDPHTQRILIVDDTIKNLQVLGTILEQEGYQINVAQNGTQALDINADGNLLRGVFHNLIKNAVEHVANCEDQRTVTVTLTQNTRQATVAIHNGGSPVPEALLSTFFEKFNTHRKQGGTGLGTTYAHLVTLSHNGEIAVSSTQSEGTTVTITLPLR